MMMAGEVEVVMAAASVALVADGPVVEAQASKIKQVSSVNKDAASRTDGCGDDKVQPIALRSGIKLKEGN
jgi:hypothetical protein